MASYEKVATFNAFINDKGVHSQRPDYSNSKCNILADIVAGEYSLGVWKTERGLSIKLERRLEDGVYTSTLEGAANADDQFDAL